MVPMTGLEPVRDCSRQIFLLLYVTIAALLRCSLDYVFSISYDLGGRCIVSTHLEKNCEPATSYTYPSIRNTFTTRL